MQHHANAVPALTSQLGQGVMDRLLAGHVAAVIAVIPCGASGASAPSDFAKVRGGLGGQRTGGVARFGDLGAPGRTHAGQGLRETIGDVFAFWQL